MANEQKIPGIKVTSIAESFYRGRWKFTREAAYLSLAELRKESKKDKQVDELDLLENDPDLRVQRVEDIPADAAAPEVVNPL